MNHPVHNVNSAAAHHPQLLNAMSKSQPHHPITVPSSRDVTCGKGQGVLRQPGNVKYRTLVSVNKVLYAKCPDSDKINISRGIVAAIRACGGGFLRLDERTGIYHDIGDVGDKGAIAKTSQALREGQPKIRKQVHQEEAAKGKVSSSSAAMSPEHYFHYSVTILRSLHHDDQRTSKDHESRAESLRESYQREALQVAMARDQFPGSKWADEAVADTNARSDSGTSNAGGRRTSASHFTIGSMPSIKSVQELLAEEPNQDANFHDKEVFLENLADVRADRVSSMRPTEMSRNKSNSDDTEATPYSKMSVMDMSIMTFKIDDMSIVDGQARMSSSGEVASV